MNAGFRLPSILAVTWTASTAVAADPVDVPATVLAAEARRIENGDLVEVGTPRGSVRFRARVTNDIAPGAIEL